MWQIRAKKRRQAWATALRISAQTRAVHRGKVLSRTKKLHTIQSVSIDDARVTDDYRASSYLAHKFGEKWGSTNLHARSILFDIIDKYAGSKFLCELEQVANIFRVIRRKYARDSGGCTVKILELLFLAKPQFFISWISRVLMDAVAMRSL